MQQTSIKAFHEIKESGVLTDLRLKVFEIICEHGPMTANEMRHHADPTANSGVFASRFSELERMDLIEKCGKRKCGTTGKTAIVWQITGRDAQPLPKQISKREKLKVIQGKIAAFATGIPENLRQPLREIYSDLGELIST